MRVVPPPGTAHSPPAHLCVLPCCGQLSFPALAAFGPPRYNIAAPIVSLVRKDTLHLKPSSTRNQDGNV